MAYTPTVWNDDGPPDILASKLNKIETGIAEAHEKLQIDGPKIYSGSGSPEGVVTAVIGSLYSRTDGGGVALYAKQTGTGNTGWFALSGTSPNPYQPPPPPSTGLVPLSQFGFNEGSGTTTARALVVKSSAGRSEAAPASIRTWS